MQASRFIILIIFVIFLAATGAISAIYFKNFSFNSNNKQLLKVDQSNNQTASSRSVPLAFAMKITSPDFTNMGKLPSRASCDGEGVNPALQIFDVPANAKSLVLIVDDPDAPRGIFTHWLVWNINPQTKTIAQNSVPDGATQGTNSGGSIGYFPACPPSGTHRYIFTIYAIDAILDLSSSATADILKRALEGHILDQAQIIGLYR